MEGFWLLLIGNVWEQTISEIRVHPASIFSHQVKNDILSMINRYDLISFIWYLCVMTVCILVYLINMLGWDKYEADHSHQYKTSYTRETYIHSEITNLRDLVQNQGFSIYYFWMLSSSFRAYLRQWVWNEILGWFKPDQSENSLKFVIQTRDVRF